MSDTPHASSRTRQALLRSGSLILWPLGLAYRLATGFRNHLYNIQYKKTIGFIPFIIDVGNLSMGGTGKSPMIEYLVNALHASYPLAVLSRGYQRKTRGFRLAGAADTALTLGDEPFQFYRKFSHLAHVAVAVGEERVAAVPEILMQHPDTQVILLDDAFQHRAIAADFHLLLTTWHKPFYQDHILPVGRLRESRQGARRADVVIVTKCPAAVKAEERATMRQRIRAYAGAEVPVFFTGIRYGTPQPVFSQEKKPFSRKVLLFSGLADGSVFEAYARSQYEVAGHISFGDHHRYQEDDIQKITTQYEHAGADTCLLTTEKDMVKLLAPALSAQCQHLPLWYLPIQTEFLHEEEAFKNTVLSRIQQYYQKA